MQTLLFKVFSVTFTGRGRNNISLRAVVDMGRAGVFGWRVDFPQNTKASTHLSWVFVKNTDVSGFSLSSCASSRLLMSHLMSSNFCRLKYYITEYESLHWLVLDVKKFRFLLFSCILSTIMCLETPQNSKKKDFSHWRHRCSTVWTVE